MRVFSIWRSNTNINEIFFVMLLLKTRVSLLLLRISEVTGSNLDLDTGYPDWGVSSFSSVRPRKCRDSTLKLGHDRFPTHPFQFTIILSFDGMWSKLLRKRRSINYKLLVSSQCEHLQTTVFPLCTLESGASDSLDTDIILIKFRFLGEGTQWGQIILIRFVRMLRNNWEIIEAYILCTSITTCT
jgi:hypothetical protein